MTGIASPILPAYRAHLLTLLLLVAWAIATLTWWVLAFPPLVDTPPAWLARLQQVCFGTDASGSPALYGWGALIAGPVGILGTLVAGWWPEIRAVLVNLPRMRWGRTLLTPLLAALIFQAGWMGWRTVLAAREPAWPLNGPVGDLPLDYPRWDRPLPQFRLVDQHSRTVTPASLQGRVAVLTFAFGHCTTLCPVTLASAVGAIRDTGSLNPGLIVITLDAWRDTPRNLQQLAEKWELPQDAILLSGPPVAVESALDGLSVGRRRNDRTGDIDHVALVYVLDRRGDLAYAFSNPPSAWIAEAIRRAARDN